MILLTFQVTIESRVVYCFTAVILQVAYQMQETVKLVEETRSSKLNSITDHTTSVKLSSNVIKIFLVAEINRWNSRYW